MSPPPRPANGVAAVILAAGESRRFGSPKQLAQLRGRTLLEHVIVLANAAGLDPVIAVVPAWFEPLASASDTVMWVRNAHPERGMSESLQLGFAGLPALADAAVILLGDQPTLPLESLASVLGRRGDRPIVAGMIDGHPTPPVLVERSQFGLVHQTSGDRGLRDLVLSNPELVANVELPPTADVDTPQDLRAIGGSPA